PPPATTILPVLVLPQGARMADRDGKKPATSVSEGTSYDASEMVAATDVGARAPIGWQATAMAAVAFIWSFFQLYYASNFPFMLSEWTGLRLSLNSTEARAVHLAFGLLLGAMAYPLFKSSPRS